MRRGRREEGQGPRPNCTLSLRSTEVFICTSPLLKYDHCVGEKVPAPAQIWLSDFDLKNKLQKMGLGERGPAGMRA